MSKMLETRGDTEPSECKHCLICLLLELVLPCLVLCDLHIYVFVDSFCLKVAYSVGMFNSTIFGTDRWSLPRYFEYDLVNGHATTRGEWIRVYVPGPWQPVADSTLGPAPDDTSTYREWRRFYHLEVYWPREGITLLWNLFRSRSPMHPFKHGIIVTGTPEDTNGLAIRTRALRAHLSLRDRRTSCTLVCPLRRHPRALMVADVRPRFSMIFNLIGASDIDT